MRRIDELHLKRSVLRESASWPTPCARREGGEPQARPAADAPDGDERQLLLQVDDNYSCRSVAVLTARARLRPGSGPAPALGARMVTDAQVEAVEAEK